MVGKYKNIFFVCLVAIIAAFSVSTLISHQAYADHPGVCTAEEKTAGGTESTSTVDGRTETTCKTATNAGTANAGQDASTNEGTTCAIQKIGWILCPVIETSGKISDQAFKFLAKTFLETQPELISNTEGKGTKYAWELSRNLANIMFIIAFLIIIYSQVTGAGITNYGIKKMLPRIIVAAIAVNASYYICQIIVDLSNIMGYEIQRFMVDAAAQITSNTAMPIASGDSFEQGGGVLSNIAIAVLAIGVVVYFLLPVLGAVISLVLVTCLSIIIILLLRKAFIVLLIVAAPVAFVAYLLPNTEKYFQKWLSMFWKLLMVFPVVGMLLGAGQLASAIILSAGANSNAYSDDSKKCINLPTAPKNGKASQTPTSSEPADCVPGAVPFSLGLTAAGIAVIPLLAVWSVLKGALSAAGAIGGKIGATVSNMDKGRKANLSKARQELGEDRKNRRALNAIQNPNSIMGTGARRRAYREARRNSVKQQLGRATEEAVYDRAYDKETGELTNYGRRMAGANILGRGADDRAIQRVATNAVDSQKRQALESVKAEHAVVDKMTEAQIRTELTNADPNNAKTAALMERLIQLVGAQGAEQHINRFASGGSSNVTTESIASSLSSQSYLGAADIANIQNGMLGQTILDANGNRQTIGSFDQVAAAGMANYTAEQFASASNKEKRYARDIASRLDAAGNHVHAAASARIASAEATARTIDSLRGKL